MPSMNPVAYTQKNRCQADRPVAEDFFLVLLEQAHRVSELDGEPVPF
jgi:hypothetical protein